MSFLDRVKRAVVRRCMPPRRTARHCEYSMLFSEDDSRSLPSERLLDVSLAAITAARRIDVGELGRRMNGCFSYTHSVPNLWPGEHYRLLAALMQVLQPALVVEIGTGEGLSALAMLGTLSPSARFVAFDIIPYREYPRNCLREEDFKDGRMRQVIADLSRPQGFKEHCQLLQQAEFIFLDAAKDGRFEPTVLGQLSALHFAAPPILLFDDIRLWSMLSVWRDLAWPKLDLTSFGHWTGTGIAELPVP